MALGANRAAVLRLVLRQGMKLVATGVAIGLVLALLVGRGLSRLLYGISPADPVSLLAASAVLLAVAFIACYIPAHFASRVDPIEALRES
jgi:ABC-type antimicrobial peptide transport system permease subunit